MDQEALPRGAYVLNGIAERIWSGHEKSEILEWGVEKVVTWLKSFLPESTETLQVFESFRRNCVNGAVLLTLTEEDLERHLHVSNFGLRRNIGLALRSLDSLTESLELIPAEEPLPNASTLQASPVAGHGSRKLSLPFQNLPGVHLSVIRRSSVFFSLITLAMSVALVATSSLKRHTISPWFSLWLLMPLYFSVYLSVQRMTKM